MSLHHSCGSCVECLQDTAAVKQLTSERDAALAQRDELRWRLTKVQESQREALEERDALVKQASSFDTVARDCEGEKSSTSDVYRGGAKVLREHAAALERALRGPTAGGGDGAP